MRALTEPTSSRSTDGRAQLFLGIGTLGARVVDYISRLLAAWPRGHENHHAAAVRCVSVVDAWTSHESYDFDHLLLRTLGFLDYGGAGGTSRDRGTLRGIEHSPPLPFAYDDHHFRGVGSEAARLVRIESRLALWHSIVHDGLHDCLAQVVDQLRTGWVGRRRQEVDVHLVCSLASPQGSGTFLPLACLVRDIIGREGRLFGYSVLPHADCPCLAESDFESACARSYAALKELEHFSKLAIDVANGGVAEVEFHYDVEARVGAKPSLRQSPLSFLYLLDGPGGGHVYQLCCSLANAVYYRVFSAIARAESQDATHFVKEQKSLYPLSITHDLREGYTNKYGTLGFCLFHVPSWDLLNYLAKRYAADAVRSYLLLDNLELVPEKVRGELEKLVPHPDELNWLSKKARAERAERLFLGRVGVLSTSGLKHFERPATLELSKLRASYEAALNKTIEELWPADMSLSPLNPAAIGQDWLPSPEAAQLFGAHERIARRVGEHVKSFEEQQAEGWWSGFFESFGSLQPHEQRVALLTLLGIEGEAEQAPLHASHKQIWMQAQQNVKELGDGQEAWVQGVTDVAAGLRPKPRGMVGRLLSGNKDKIVAQAATDSVVKAFSGKRRSLERALKLNLRALLEECLQKQAERLRILFQEVDKAAEDGANELVAQAEALREKGGPLANLAAMDEEALMSPSGRRMWDYYYTDQIAARYREDQPRIISAAVLEAMKPRYEGGRRIDRSAREVIRDIFARVEKDARALLEVHVDGDWKKDFGLTIDKACALEAVYCFAFGDCTTDGENAREALAGLASQGARLPLDANALATHERWGPIVERHTQQKIRVAVDQKAALMAAVSDADLPEGAFTRNLLIGARKEYIDEQTPFGRAMRSTIGAAGNFVADWYDPKRIVLFRHLKGVPLYAFTNVVGEQQLAYRKLRADSKALPLHIDRNFETLMDLDPRDLLGKLEEKPRVAAAGAKVLQDLLLAFAKGVLELGEGGAVVLRVAAVEPGAKDEPVGADLDEALATVASWEQTRNPRYDLALKEPVAAMRKALLAPVRPAEVVSTLHEWAGSANRRWLLVKRTDPRLAEALRRVRDAMLSVAPGPPE